MCHYQSVYLHRLSQVALYNGQALENFNMFPFILVFLSFEQLTECSHLAGNLEVNFDP